MHSINMTDLINFGKTSYGNKKSDRRKHGVVVRSEEGEIQKHKDREEDNSREAAMEHFS